MFAAAPTTPQPAGVTLLVEPAGRVGEHGVNLARIGRQVRAGHRAATFAARNVFKEPLEFLDVLLHRLAELGIAAILAADFIECALPLRRVKTPIEQATFAALIALPQLGSGAVVDHAGYIDGERLQRVDTLRAFVDARRLARGRRRRDRRTVFTRSPRQKIAQPSAAAGAATVLLRAR